MFFAAMVACSPNSFRRFCTAALRISPMFTSAMRTFPCVSRSTSSTPARSARSEEHTSELQSRLHLVCRLLLEKKKKRRRGESDGYAGEVIGRRRDDGAGLY